MDNFNFNLFKYFYYVAFYKGFNNASKNLNLAQSSLSYNVKILEDLLGKKLIIRNNKNFALTEDGYNLYETLRFVFGVLENNLKHYSGNNMVYEELTIGIRHYLSNFIFKDTIKTFTRMYPNIHLNIKLYSKLDVNKYNEEYDILIDYADYVDLIDNGDKKLLCKLNNIIVSGSSLYDKYVNVKSLKELDGNKFISLSPNKKNGKFQKLCYDNNLLLNDVISIDDCLLRKKLVIDNLGLAFVNEEYVIDELRQDKIKKIEVNDFIFEDEVIAVCKEKKNKENISKFMKILFDSYSNGSDNNE